MHKRVKSVFNRRSQSSQRRIGRTVLRFGSKRVFLCIVVVMLSSLTVGALILNKKEDSKAASRAWGISSQNGFGGELGWNFAHQGIPIDATNNAGQNLKMTYKAGTTIPQGLHGCWRLPVPSSVRVHTVKFRITSNAAGANRVAIGIQNSTGYIEPFVNAGVLNGSEQLDFTGLDVPPGGIIQVCNRVTEDGNPATPNTTFGADRYVYVNDYAFFGTETYTAPYAYTVVDYINPPGTMVVGQTAEVTWRVKNDGYQTWYGERSANATRLGTWKPQDRSSVFHSEGTAGSNWLNRSRIRMVESQVVPGQIATFKYIVTARAQGTYTEHFNLVTEGIVWHPEQPLSFAVNVPAPTYSYSIVSATKPPAVMAPGQVSPVAFKIKNTGNATWYAEGATNPMRLGTWLNASTSRDSVFNTTGWLSASRIALSRSGVGPGQEVDVNFNVKAPNTPGVTYNEEFNLVREGVAWLPYSGVSFQTRIGNPCTNNAVNALSIEAESASCGPNDSPGPGEVQADALASGQKRTLLFLPTQYVEYTIKPTQSGIYRAGAVLKMEGQGVVSHTLTKFIPGASSVSTNESRAPSTTVYNTSFMTQTAQYQNLTTDEISKGVSFRVRTTFLRPGGITTGDTGNLFVDKIYLEKVGELASATKYCANNAGTVTTSVEAESSSCGPDTLKPVVEADPVASGQKRTLLYASNQYAEYTFNPTTSGTYRAGGIVKSEDFNGSAVGRYTLTKFTPGQPSFSSYEDRDSPSGGFDRRFMTQSGNYQQLTSSEIAAGVSFRVRITFLNDANGGTAGGDRNLFVDTLYIEKVSDLPLQCMNLAANQSLSVEAEDGICGPDISMPIVQPDPAASSAKRVLLSKGNQYVQYTFKPSVPGVYTAGGILKSLDYNGPAIAEFTFTKKLAGQPEVIYKEPRAAPSGTYDRRFITQAANRQYVTADQISKGVTLQIRATYTNDVYISSTQDRNLIVDTLYIENIQPLTETGTCVDADPGTIKIAQAESSSRGPTSPYPSALYDANASGEKMVFLSSNNQYVQQSFTVGPCEAGKYVPGVRVRGEQYPKATLPRFELSIVVNGVTTTKEFAAEALYDVVRYYKTEDYQSLKVGDKVTVRVKFINDARLSTMTVSNPYDDRNLIVDDIRLIELPEIDPDHSHSLESHRSEVPNLALSGSKNIGNGGTSTVPSGIEDPFGTIQAENALRFGLTRPVTDTVRTPYVAAKLFSNKDLVRHTFMDYPGGSYMVDVVARSEVLADRQHGQIKVTAYIGGTTKTILSGITTDAGSAADPTQYARKSYKIKVPYPANYDARQRITIEVQFINDAKSSTADRNVLVDLIRLRPVTAETSSASNSKKLTSPTGIYMEAQGDPFVFDVDRNDFAFGGIEPSINCRIRNVIQDCYDASVYTDVTATGSDFVRLGSTGDKLTYRFTVQQGGPHVVGFSLRSQDYRGSAKARINFNGIVKDVTAPTSGYQFFTYPVTDIGSNSINTLSVEFLNDQCGYSILGVSSEPCDSGHDRNLRVDRIQILPALPAGQRSTTDRVDETQGPMIRAYYLIPRDGVDHGLDTNGFIEDSLNRTQTFTRQQTGGRSFIFDKNGSKYDITFIRSNKTGAELAGDVYGGVKQELTRLGMMNQDRVHAVYYDGPRPPANCGMGGGVLAVTYVDCSQGRYEPYSYFEGTTFIEAITAQEILHALGFMQRHFVPGVSLSCGPNVGPGIYSPNTSHANLPNDALSYSLPMIWMDKNRTDYVGHNNPDPKCLDLIRSNYVTLD